MENLLFLGVPILKHIKGICSSMSVLQCIYLVSACLLNICPTWLLHFYQNFIDLSLEQAVGLFVLVIVGPFSRSLGDF